MWDRSGSPEKKAKQWRPELRGTSAKAEKAAGSSAINSHTKEHQETKTQQWAIL
jgi:hypothetical protein